MNMNAVIRECLPLCSSCEELLECVAIACGRALWPTEAERVCIAWALR